MNDDGSVWSKGSYECLVLGMYRWNAPVYEGKAKWRQIVSRIPKHGVVVLF